MEYTGQNSKKLIFCQYFVMFYLNAFIFILSVLIVFSLFSIINLCDKSDILFFNSVCYDFVIQEIFEDIMSDIM